MATVDETESTNDAHNKCFLLLNYLDSIEDSIENIFKKAQDLSQEKDTLLTVLSQLEAESDAIDSDSLRNGQYEEIQSHIERLKQRCISLDIKIHKVRSKEQEHSYTQVDSLIKSLEHVCIEGDPDDITYKKQAESYLNACVSDMHVGGPVDYRFQGMILDCKLEDQKEVRQRLECLVQGRIHDEHLDNLLSGTEIKNNEAKSDSNVQQPANSTETNAV